MENLRRINETINEKSMKIQWKIVQNRAWRRVGPSWGLLGWPIGFLERLGSILGASWERLGASWGRSGGSPEREGDPTWTPGREQNRPRIDVKSHRCFDRFLDAILIPKWSQNGCPTLPKAVQTSVPFFDRFFHRLLDRSWGPKSLKMSNSCRRETHFHKIAYSDSDRFLEAKMMKKAFKMEPKWLNKWKKKQRSFLSILDLFFKAFGSMLGVKIPLNIE